MVYTIRVKTLDGQTRSVEVDEEKTVLEFKELLKESHGIDAEPSTQRLIYQGRVLSNTDKIKDVNPNLDQKAVHLVTRAPPPPPEPPAAAAPIPAATQIPRMTRQGVAQMATRGRPFTRRNVSPRVNQGQPGNQGHPGNPGHPAHPGHHGHPMSQQGRPPRPPPGAILTQSFHFPEDLGDQFRAQNTEC